MFWGGVGVECVCVRGVDGWVSESICLYSL